MIEDVVEAARAAGQLIRQVQREGFGVEQKGDQGPVTRADRGADRLLRERLLELEPCGWLSEETADRGERLAQERLWIVDPLDGTREFVAEVPEFAVAVALVDPEGPRLAVLHNPATEETFWAERGRGAHRGGGERLHVAEGERLLASRTELDRGEFAPFRDAWEVVPVGSVAYKLALVAAGRGAVTLSRGPKWEWDVCAGALLVSEAGGRVTDLRGRPLSFNRRRPKVRGVIAGAPDAYARAVRVVERVGPSDRMAELDVEPEGEPGGGGGGQGEAAPSPDGRSGGRGGGSPAGG